MNPISEIKGIVGYYGCMVLTTLMAYDKMRPEITNPVRREEGCYYLKMSNEQVAKKIFNVVRTFKNPLLISTDFKQYDSTIDDGLLNIDRKYLLQPIFLK